MDTAEKVPSNTPPGTIPVERFDVDRGIYLPGTNEGTAINFSPTTTVSPHIKPEIHIDVGSGLASTSENSTSPTQIPVVEAMPAATPIEGGLTIPETVVDPNQELRQMILEQGRQIQALTEQIQALVALLSAKAESGTTQEVPKTLPEPSTDEKAAAEAAAEAAKKEADEKAADEAAELAKKEAAEELTAKIAAAEIVLNKVRDTLLEITIRRKARMGDKFTIRPDRGMEDKEAYGDVMAAYKDSLASLLRLKAEAMETAEPPSTVGEIKLQQRRAMYEEQRLFTNREFELQNQLLDKAEHSADDKNILSKLLAKRYKLVRKWANLSTKKKIMIGVGIGAGVALASGTMGGGLALLAVGSAARFSLGLLNKNASARNVSTRSRDQELERINRAEGGEFTYRLDTLDTEQHGAEQVTKVENYIDGRVQYAQRRNRIAGAVMALGVVGAGVGAAELAGVGLPNFHIPHPWGGGPNHTGGGSGFPGGAEQMPTGGRLDFSHFNPDSFGGQGMGPHESVKSMLDVLHRNGIEAHGLSDAKISQIIEDMRSQHMNVAFGMDNLGHQHLVDAAQGYSGATTPNEFASGLQGLEKVNGSSVTNWEKFAKIVQNRGVELTQNVRG